MALWKTREAPRHEATVWTEPEDKQRGKFAPPPAPSLTDDERTVIERFDEEWFDAYRNLLVARAGEAKAILYDDSPSQFVAGRAAGEQKSLEWLLLLPQSLRNKQGRIKDEERKSEGA